MAKLKHKKIKQISLLFIDICPLVYLRNRGLNSMMERSNVYSTSQKCSPIVLFLKSTWLKVLLDITLGRIVLHCLFFSKFRECCDGSGLPKAFGISCSVVASSVGHSIKTTHNRLIEKLQHHAVHNKRPGPS